MRHSKLRGLERNIASRNKRLHRLWRSSYPMKDYKQALKIPISPLLVIVRESNLQYIF